MQNKPCNCDRHAYIYNDDGDADDDDNNNKPLQLLWPYIYYASRAQVHCE